MSKQQGRRIGTKVRLTPFARQWYPQFAVKVGRITGRAVLTPGNGLAYGIRGYRVSYAVRFAGEKRDYFLSARYLVSV